MKNVDTLGKLDVISRIKYLVLIILVLVFGKLLNPQDFGNEQNPPKSSMEKGVFHQDEKVFLEVFNVIGVSIFGSEEFDPSKKSASERVLEKIIPNKTPRIYYLSITEGDSVIVKKIIVLKEGLLNKL